MNFPVYQRKLSEKTWWLEVLLVVRLIKSFETGKISRLIFFEFFRNFGINLFWSGLLPSLPNCFFILAFQSTIPKKKSWFFCWWTRRLWLWWAVFYYSEATLRKLEQPGIVTYRSRVSTQKSVRLKFKNRFFFLVYSFAVDILDRTTTRRLQGPQCNSVNFFGFLYQQSRTEVAEV